MFCRNCGSMLPDGTKFCSNCGACVSAPQQPVDPVNFDNEATVIADPVPVAPAVEAAPVAPEYQADPAAPVMPVYQAPATPVAAPQPPKKKNTGLVIGLVIASVVAVAAIVTAILFGTGVIGGKDKAEDEEKVEKTSVTQAVDEEETTEHTEDKGDTIVLPSNVRIAVEDAVNNAYGGEAENVKAHYILCAHGVAFYIVTAQIGDEAIDETYENAYIVTEVFLYKNEASVETTGLFSADEKEEFETGLEEYVQNYIDSEDRIKGYLKNYAESKDGAVVTTAPPVANNSYCIDCGMPVEEGVYYCDECLGLVGGTCYDCGKIIDSDRYYCDECLGFVAGICYYCGATVDSDSFFCDDCLNSSFNYCLDCGAAIDADSYYCDECLFAEF